MSFGVIHGDCLAVLAGMAENSLDAAVTDPPYHLTGDNRTPLRASGDPAQRARVAAGGFMNAKWDGGDVAFRPETWAAIMRVLKPGGHLVAFGGTRTYHRLACAIEDAGFEIRDMLAWLYGSGFPKSLDVSKAIDKAAGTGREVVGSKVGLPGYSLKDNDTDGHGRQTYSRFTNADAECAITAPATDAARRWEGWGTALKPAHEPICLARKPLSEGTVAANVLRWGTGALNIDACRTETNPNVDDPRLGGKGSWGTTKMAKNVYKGGYAGVRVGSSALGRWPANLAHDGSDEVVAMFPDAAGGGNIKQGRDPGYGGGWQTQAKPSMGDSGSAARFFASFPMEDECPSIKYANDVEEALSLRSERVVSALSHAVGQSTRRLALQSTSAPSVLALTRQMVPQLRLGFDAANRCAPGAYEIVASGSGGAVVSLFATGSEVVIAVAAQKLLNARGIAARVVSVPCFELFLAVPEAERAEIVGQAKVNVAVEAGIRQSWDAIIGSTGAFVGMTTFGASAPYKDLYKHSGITPEKVAEAALAHI